MTRIAAPLSGWLAPLSEVSDPVFASGSMGEGFAIDPIDGVVVAPCAARVSAVAPTGHSVTLDADGGGTLLIHIGLDTVALKGRGFEVKVREGERVTAGYPLIAFDLDLIGREARSLMTPVVAIGEGDRLRLGESSRLVQSGDTIAELVAGTPANAAPLSSQPEVTRTVIVPMPHGIHARPAARIVAATKAYLSSIELQLGERSANARSTTALLKLGAKKGDELIVAAAGDDAAAAAEAIAGLIGRGMGEREAVPAGAPAGAAVIAAPGLAIAVAARLQRTDLAVPEKGGDPAEERAALAAALQTVDNELAKAGGLGGDIAAAHRALLGDPELRDLAGQAIDQGRSAGAAWREATRATCAALEATGEPLLRERVADMIDVERQVIATLLGTSAKATAALPPSAILLADDLLPSEFQALDLDRLKGIALAGGGPTSHAAILAASAGIPMLVALGERIDGIADGTPLVLDAEQGRLDVDPGPEALDRAEQRLAARRAARARERAEAGAEARTADGVRIEVFANLGSVEDTGRAVAEGAEGCGLLRTEFLFLGRETAPSEDEQARIYGTIAAALGERPLIVRTFDIGGDKPAPYLPMAREENPALGLRGVRLNLARSDLLDTQLRAIVRGVPDAQRRIMVPMVIEASELLAVRDRLRAAEAELGVASPTPLGVMVETPAASLLGASIAEHADFLSVGSNDLTQYALACDRGNAATAARLDPVHPAVLRLIGLAAEGARAHGRWLGVCGGVASDPGAVPLLLGLGVTELSVAPGQIAAIKAAARACSLADCRALATRALAMGDASAVRALIREVTS